jgi:hypothetical protein
VVTKDIFIKKTNIIKFPREALTGETTTYADGTVVRSRASDYYLSNDLYNVWKAFDGIKYSGDVRWTTNRRYQSTGFADTDRSDFYFKDHSSFYGEYFIIDLGEQIVLDHFIHYGLNGANNRSPVDFRMYATNDVSAYDNTKSGSWVQIQEWLGTTGYADNTGKTFTLATKPPAYRYFAIITNTIGADAFHLEFSELEFYGIPLHEKFPREALTGETTTYADGTVVNVKASSFWDSRDEYSIDKSFNNVFDDAGWISEGSTYVQATGKVTSPTAHRTVDGYKGEYFIIDLGENILLDHIKIYPNNLTSAGRRKRRPKFFRIYASNSLISYDDINDLDWELIFEVNSPSVDGSLETPHTYQINSKVPYKYYTMIVNEIFEQSSDAESANIAELEFYGHRHHEWKIYGNQDNQFDLSFDTSVSNTLWKTSAKIRGNGGTSGYVNFTGVHHCVTSESSQHLYDNKYIGYIVSSTKKYKSMNSTIDINNIGENIDKNAWDALPIVELATEKDKKVFGVISKIDDNSPFREQSSGNIVSYFEKKEQDRRLHIAGVGEGCIWVCDYGNTTIEGGDYITSSPISGIGMRQDDDLVHSYTVGKATMDCDFNPKTIPVKILSGTDNTTYIDLLDNEGNIVYEDEYEMKYVRADGRITDKNDYITNPGEVFRMAFIGCTYTCS